MIFFIVIVIVSCIIIGTFNVALCFDLFNNSILLLIGLIILGVVIEYVIDMIVAGIVVATPKKWYNYERFKTFKWEKRFYNFLKIKSWKDKIPIGKGPLGNGFAKDKIKDSNDVEYLERFLMDNCRAEVMHIISFFLGFLLIFIFPLQYAFCISLPIALVNALLQLMPIFVQRYTRPKLVIAYIRAVRESNKKK